MERYRLIPFDMQPVSPVAAFLLSAPFQTTSLMTRALRRGAVVCGAGEQWQRFPTAGLRLGGDDTVDVFSKSNPVPQV